MRRLAIAAAGLAWVAGCAAPVPPPGPAPFALQPLPGETLPDPDDPDFKACLAVVSLYHRRTGLGATGVAPDLEGGRIFTISDGIDRWQCRVDADGRVTAMVPLTG